jgi:glycosyltransferase involved in cell wall biosynthesis
LPGEVNADTYHLLFRPRERASGCVKRPWTRALDAGLKVSSISDVSKRSRTPCGDNLRPGNAILLESKPAIAVVIATRDRPHLLSERALSSVVAQTRSPENLIVADDSSPEVRTANREIVEALQIPGCRITYLENTRTEGASGSWNTALDYLLAEVVTADRVFVALLDDDDAWRSTYLETCTAAAHEAGLDMVAADLYRIESPDQPPRVQKAPEVLRADDCLVGNPGIQGSNIFIRLSVLLTAGGFDEALQSTTDRDLCIRIADLGSVRYGRLAGPLVDHYADTDRARLSTYGSQSKLQGLSAFWRKHSGRMSYDQRAAFSKRAAELFGWSSPAEPCIPDGPRSIGERPAVVVLGLVADNERPALLFETVRVLAECDDRNLVGLYVVLFESGARSGEEPSLIEAAATALRDAGVGAFCVTLEWQREAGAGHSTCCAAVAQGRIGSELWLAGPCPRIDERPGASISDILRWLGAERTEGSNTTPPPDSVGDSDALQRWVQQERATTAEHRVRKRYVPGRLRVLGSGSESVVFTDDHMVYKCIDYWKTRMPRSRVDFLRRQVGRWAGRAGLVPLRDVVEDGPWVILSYDYEPSTPFRGGHEEGMVALLDSCTLVGIVCNNVHPKNLIVTASGVKLIDYGSDIRPWSRLGFEHMARRAFLTCRHAAHPDLQELLRRALTDIQLPELVGYSGFRARLADPPFVRQSGRVDAPGEAPPHAPLSIYVGVITSDPATLLPLLRGLGELAKAARIARVVAVVLDNASPTGELDAVLGEARRADLEVALVSVAQQRQDAREGRFGSVFRERPATPMGIAAARTMLQRYLGALMAEDPGSFGWLLDDDMRVDQRARAYLSWLPAFRAEGVDVLIGAYEGTSPNPPLNGLRVQLVDLVHNLLWLQALPPEAPLPDRSGENARLRSRFPDYYYDLSRKHTAHLENPCWLEPMVEGETVAEAHARLVADAVGVLSGAALTRPILSTVPADPISAASDSVNRGGCTFVLNARALTETPNTITQVAGREARRSDMIWAIVNRYYRGVSVKAVAFPVLHVGRVTHTPSLDADKVQSELVGSALYAGLTEFLRSRPRHALDFSPEDIDEIRRESGLQLDRRLRGLQQSFYRIAGLREAIRGVVRCGELEVMLSHLDRWITPDAFGRIRDGVRSQGGHELHAFLSTLRAISDDYAGACVNTDFIKAQLRAGTESCNSP